MATPSVLDVTHTGGYAATTSHSVAMPASVSSGQLLLMHIAVDGNKTFTTPTDWSIVVARAASAFNFQSTITYGKVSVGTEGGTNVTVTTSASGEGQAAVWRIGDWHGTLADDVTGVTGTYFNTTGPNPPSRSWGWGTDDVLAIAIAGGTSTHTVSSYPTNYSDNQFDEDGGDTTIGITGATRSMIGASSPEDPGAFTFGSNATGVVTTIVVRGLAATGTIAAELQNALFSGSGTQTQTGTIVATLQKATAAFIGAMQPSGAAAATMQPATFSGSGTSLTGAEGSIAATLQKATAAFVGEMPYSGTVAATLQEPTFAGTGAQTQTGTIAAELQEPTFAGSGVQVYTGTMAGTLQYPTFSGAGAQIYTGSMAATLQEPTAALVGVMQPSGVIAVTMQPATFTGAGTHQQIGAIAAALQAATFTGAGLQIYTGTMAGTLRYLTFEGIGVLAMPGFAIVLDSYADGIRLLDQYADGITLTDAYADGMKLFDLAADGITVDDDYSNGARLYDGRQ